MTAQAAPQKIIVVAGPNGAGKTTFARSFLPMEPGLPRFINADAIAAGLAAFAPETAAIRAGRLMLEEIGLCVRRGESFAFETTLSGKGYLSRIAEWRAQGYHVSLMLLSLPNAETAIARVASRVRQGGHRHEPDRRFAREEPRSARLARRLRRAAALARHTAIQTDTEIVLVRGGKPVRVPAAKLRKSGK